MKIMRSAEVENVHGQTYRIIVRKHVNTFDDYGFPYSIRTENANPEAFDLNTHVFLYDDWQTAYKRARELAEEYKVIEPRIMPDVDGRTGKCI